MPGSCNITRHRGKICKNGTHVRSAEKRLLAIHRAKDADDAPLANGTKVSFTDHHGKEGNMAANVREIHTRKAPSARSLLRAAQRERPSVS